MHKRIILIYNYTYTYSNNMVKIQYHPIKTTVIHEILKHDLNYFIYLKTQNRNPNTPAPVARWADGILFEFADRTIEIGKKFLSWGSNCNISRCNNYNIRDYTRTIVFFYFLMPEKFMPNLYSGQKSAKSTT